MRIVLGIVGVVLFGAVAVTASNSTPSRLAAPTVAPRYTPVPGRENPPPEVVEPFERYSPYGTPENVAEFLQPYLDAGCAAVNVIPCAEDDETAIASVGELRSLLTAPAPSLATR